MVKISLTISTANVDPPQTEKVDVELSDEQVKLLRRYSENVARLERSQLVQTGLPEITHIKMDHTGLTFTVSEFKYDDLCGLLHVARPLLLSAEPASFQKTMGVLGKQCDSTLFRKHLKNLWSIYETGDYGRYFQMRINDIPLFSDQAVKLWLNGVEYHQDEEKAAVIASIEKSLSEETTRKVFAATLCGRIRALFLLDLIVGKALAIIDKKAKPAADDATSSGLEVGTFEP
jgi:hypothetical protein